MFVRVEVQEEVLDFFDHLGDAGVGPVDLVNKENDGQSLLQGLAQDESRLGKGALGRVDQQDDRVDHRQAPFDLAAEVRVTRCVDDVDGEVVPLDRGVLGEDGDALFALQVTGVHDPLGEFRVGRKGARLAQHLVHQRGFPVVHVGDDGDITKGGAGGHSLTTLLGEVLWPNYAASRA